MSFDKKYLPLVISTAAASFMVNLDTYIINVSVPAIATDFGVSKTDVSWVIMAYNLMVVALLLICGKLADKIGLKKLFVGGFVLFTVSSLACALSENIIELTAARGVQGIGASILYALPQAIIGKFLPIEKRGKGFALSASAAALGIMLGSPLSGLITGFSSWHWIFLINVPVGILIVDLLLHDNDVFVEQNNEVKNNNCGAFDIKGSVLSFFGILGLTFWLNRLNSLGFSNPVMVALLIVSFCLTGWFVWHCIKAENPLVDLNLFKNKYFSFANLAMFMVSAFLAGNNFIIPFYLTEIKHFSELQIGLYFIIYSASYMIFSLSYGKISNRVSASKVSTAAAFLATLTVLFFLLNIYQTSNLFVVAYLVLLGASFSFFITSNNNFVMFQATMENAGAVAGLHRMTGRFGMLFGVVVFEFLFTFADKSNLNGYVITYLVAMIVCLLTALLSAKCLGYKNKEGV